MMKYLVKHKENGQEIILDHTQINDMEYDTTDNIIVFDLNMEAYLLINDEI
ncbi:hypothetical protein HQN89_29935 [Paenibacillus frigoriresistens]|uniref:hypothetical protein n=1 Tax=Paenibacillus alginolyticus TaxID=59839 RepID=UPI0015649470|nr:hypothetical protein [Paenibacillus frigoriresistens]NRF95112.1 hypothetical protein [Paenibacillus frigoriresistens]